MIFLTLGAAAAAAAVASWYLLDYLYIPRHLPGEPPAVRPSIPYLGHIIGLLRHGTKYYEITSKNCKLPIYTLNMLNGKVYIVTSPTLVGAVNRSSKVLAFNPFIAQLGKRITGHDETTSRIVQHNLNGENGSGYVIEVHDATLAALAPGRSLEKMTGAMLWEASAYLDKLKDQEVNLFGWTQQMVTMCSTRAIYGPKNPFNSDPNLTTAFWEFNRNLNILLVNLAPNILAPKGNRARLAVAVAFQQYFENFISGTTPCSAMTQARYTTNTRHGISSHDQGRLEVGTLIGILANTIPAIFYTLVHVYSDPILLQDIRAELETTFVSTPDPGEPMTRHLWILRMRENCHLLHSTFQEILRLHARGASARFVREDIMLDGQYLLKKGMVVQMPMGVMHSDPTIWGADVTEFQPRRFLKKQQNPTAYRPFGGGASLCPGRHFVTLETLALTACMVLRYDMASVDGEPLRIPTQKQESMATNVFPPEHDIRVRFTEREDCKNVTWSFTMS